MTATAGSLALEYNQGDGGGTYYWIAYAPGEHEHDDEEEGDDERGEEDERRRPAVAGTDARQPPGTYERGDAQRREDDDAGGDIRNHQQCAGEKGA